jgi:hypothetical protein
MLKNVLAVATIFLALLSLPASATPFVEVRATWSAAPSAWYALPAGLTMSCFGDAAGGSTSCSNTIYLSRTVTESATYSASESGGIVVKNTSDHAIDGFVVLDVWYSAFNPGGPRIGLGIDNALTQAARFESRVAGHSVLDSHSCAVGFLGQQGTVYSSTTCGVSSPDSSLAPAVAELVNFLPGAEVIFTWGLNIAATFELGGAHAGVPEPLSALLLLVGLSGFAVRLRRYRNNTSHCAGAVQNWSGCLTEAASPSKRVGSDPR